MRRLFACATVAACLMSASVSEAANSVVVESRSLGVNVVDVPIHVLVENDVDLRDIIVPLVIREAAPGSFITSLQMRWAERVPASGGMFDLARFTMQYPEPDGSCGPVGFSTQSANDTLPHPVAASPEGAIFVGISITSNLPAGADTSGSLVMSVSTTGVPGTFEIDTACVDPNNHLSFNDANANVITPNFTKGIITIVPNLPPTALCTDVTVSADANCEADASIDAGSFDPDNDPVTLAQNPPGPYTQGPQQVELIVTDPLGGRSSCTATVTVIDDTPPVLVCHADTVVTSPDGNGVVVDFTLAAVDNCSAVTLSSMPPSGSLFPVGITTVSCTAFDDSGNTSVCLFRVVVVIEGAGYCNERAEDSNCDGQVDAVDLAHLIDVMFFGTPEHGSCCYQAPPK